MPLRLIIDNEPTGEILKDEGIASALRFIDPLLWRAWEDAVYDLLEGWKGISEEIRFVVEARGFHAHPNHWGAMTNASVRAGSLAFVQPEEWWRTTDPKSHHRKSQVLTRLDWL